MNAKIVKLLNYLLAKDFDPEDISEMYKFIKNELNITNSEVLNIAPILYRKYYPLLDDGEDFRSIENMNVDYDEDDIDDRIIALSQHLEVHPLTLKTIYNENNIQDSRDESEYLVGDEDEIREIFFDRVDDRVQDLKEYNPDYILDFLTLDEGYAEQFAEDEAGYRYENEEPEDVIGYLNQREEHEKWMERLEEAETELNDVDNLITDLDYDIENETGEFSEEELENMEERRELLSQRFTELETFIDNWDDDEETKKFADTLEDDYVEFMARDIYDEIERRGLDFFVDDYGYSTLDAIDSFFDIDEDAMKEDLYDTDRAGELAYYDGDEHEEEVNGEYYFIYRQG
jgi:hypothetical protein